MRYERLLDGIGQINSTAQIATARAVNQLLTLRNWLIGAWIVEYEQQGEDRAVYGEALLRGIAQDMATRGCKGLSLSSLKGFRKFALTYPVLAKSQTLSGLLMPLLETNTALIGQTPSVLSTATDPGSLVIEEERGESSFSLTELLELGFPSLEARIPQVQPFEWQNSHYYLNLFRVLPWAHLVELSRLDDPLKRVFYELESVKGNWSNRELKRQINSMLYERVGLSKNKSALLMLANQGKLLETPAMILRDPYVLEFLELEEKEAYTESMLEQALIDHLQHFIHELGRDFCFVERQLRIPIANRNYYLDLLFYHRRLHCLIAIDLKLGEFQPGYAGQMNLYLNYLKQEVALPDESPPVGILLCSEKDGEEVHFATAGMDNQLFVSRYLMELPSEAQLKKWLRDEQERLESQQES